MRNLLFAVALVCLTAACDGTENAKEQETGGGTTEKPTLSEEPSPQLTEVQTRGKKLMEMSTCPTCHAINEKLVGPAYVDVARRYDEEADTTLSYLAGKVINGGKGNWGEVPMTPNPQVSQEEAEDMVRFILSLNDQE
ncbi:c-type cytochrome [Roseivirga sp. BDSF3-8]|uniref:c-type cytochrome n=1 Tax=Roseivirga sp. BDSF3-8 TaxID=3241598 RepID=UPI003531CC36